LRNPFTKKKGKREKKNAGREKEIKRDNNINIDAEDQRLKTKIRKASLLTQGKQGHIQN